MFFILDRDFMPKKMFNLLNALVNINKIFNLQREREREERKLNFCTGNSK